MRLHRVMWARFLLAGLGAMAVGCSSPSEVYRYTRWRFSDAGRATRAYEEAGRAAAARKYDEAIRLYQKVMRLAPSESDASYRRAVVLVRAGRSEAFWPAMEEAVRRGYSMTWEIDDEPVLRELRKDPRYAPLRSRISENEKQNHEKLEAADRLPERSQVPSFSTLESIDAEYKKRNASLMGDANRSGASDSMETRERQLQAWRVAALRRYVEEHPMAGDRAEAAVSAVRVWAAMAAYSPFWRRGMAAGVREGAEAALALNITSAEASEVRFIRAVSVLRGVLDEGSSNHWLDSGVPPLDTARALPLFEEGADANPTDPWSTRAAAYVALCTVTEKPEGARQAYERFLARPAIPEKSRAEWDFQVRDVVREVRLRLEGPPDFTAETIDGRKVTLSQLKGQVVLVDFWSPG